MDHAIAHRMQDLDALAVSIAAARAAWVEWSEIALAAGEAAALYRRHRRDHAAAEQDAREWVAQRRRAAAGRRIEALEAQRARLLASVEGDADGEEVRL